MRRRIVVAVIVFSLLAVVIPVSCSETQQTQAEAAAMIGPDGGVVEVTDPDSPISGVRLEIPMGALEEEQLVTINVSADDESFGMGSVLDLGPNGLSFNEPINVYIPYTDQDIVENNIIDESLLSIYHLNDELGLWVKESDSSVNPAENMVYSTIDHFSKIGVTGDQLINVNAVVDENDQVPDKEREQLLFLHGIQLPAHEFWAGSSDNLLNILSFKGAGYGNYEDTFGCVPELLAMDPEKKYQVWAVHYDSWDPIENKGSMLGQAISKIQSELGDPNAKVSIIAHSLGGIIARWHVQRPLYPGDVSKILMTGSPNHGSPLADVMDYILDALRDRIAAELGTVPWVGTILSAAYGSLVEFAPSFEQLSVDSDFLNDLNSPSLKPIPSDIWIYNVFTDNLQLLGIPFTDLGDGVVSCQSASLDEFDPNNILEHEIQDYWHVQSSLLGWDNGIAHIDCSPEEHDTWTLIGEFLTDICLRVDGEGLDDGDPIPGWDLVCGGPPAIATVTATDDSIGIHSGDRGVRVNGDYAAGKEFDIIAKGIVAVDYWHYPKPGTSTNSMFALHGGNHPGTPDAYLHEGVDYWRYLTVHKNDEDLWWISDGGGSSHPSVASYSEKYTHIVITIDTNTGLFDLVIDEELVHQGTVENADKIETSGIRYVSVHSGRGGSGTNSYFDDIVVTCTE